MTWQEVGVILIEAMALVFLIARIWSKPLVPKALVPRVLMRPDVPLDRLKRPRPKVSANSESSRESGPANPCR